MWRADRQHDDGDDGTRSAVAPTSAPGVVAPGALSLGRPGLEVGNAAEPIREGWRRTLSSVGGSSTLLHFGD